MAVLSPFGSEPNMWLLCNFSCLVFQHLNSSISWCLFCLFIHWLFVITTIQKSFNHDGQGGHHFSLTPFPVQHDVNSVHRPRDVKMFSVPNQAISVSMGNPFLNNHFATGGQNMNGTGVKQPLLGGIPVSVPHLVIPNAGAVAGMVEPW